MCTIIRLCIPDGIHTIECPPGAVTFITTRATSCIIDPGYLNKNWSDTSWIDYQLLPHIIKYTGTDAVDTLIILRTTKKTVENLAQFIIPTFPIKKLYCCIEANLYNTLSKKIYRLRKVCDAHKVTLYMLMHPETIEVYHDSVLHIILSNESRMHTKDKGWMVQGTLHKKSFTMQHR